MLLVRFLLAPLEFPKLANAQPSNFGPLRMLIFIHSVAQCLKKGLILQKMLEV